MNKKLLTLFLAICMICTLVPFGAFAAGNVEQVNVEVTYNQSAARRMLKMVNEFRQSDDAWYWSKNNRSQLTPESDLGKLTFDYTLEKIAMQRAAELVINMDHTRPNGREFDSLVDSNYVTCAENCTAGPASYKDAFNAFRNDDGNYASQTCRRNMLSEKYNAAGIASVYYNGYYYWVIVFGKTDSPDKTACDSNNSDTTVSIEVNTDMLNTVSISTDAETPVTVGLDKPVDLPALTTTINMDETWPDGSESAVIPDYTWATSNRNIVKIDKGQLKGVKEGVATVTVSALGSSYSFPVQVVPKAGTFKDVKTSSYYFDAVEWAVEEGITTGVSKTLFAPDDTCTRAQVVTFLWRLAGEPTPMLKKSPFKDVSKTDYYYKAVLWAVENDITTGVDKTHFAPDDDCTRGQVVTFLHRYDGEPKPGLKKCPFSDVEKGDYCYKPVLWAVNEGITTGVSKTLFAPDDTCTRCEVVTFLYRYNG